MAGTEDGKQSYHIWSSIQKEKEKETTAAVAEAAAPPYIHPLVRRSLTLMSQKSLETCTESLGSETGSDGLSRRWPERSFPPPLRSISCRNGPCLKMKPFRRNGRLIVEAVTVPSRNYLHAERRSGRLLLSFIETNSVSNAPVSAIKQPHNPAKEDNGEEEEYDEDVEEEEEVEVVDRGTMVEVKVSSQPPPVSRGAYVKVHRSSLVINKFVIGSPLIAADYPQTPATFSAGSPRRQSLSTATAAAAAVAASSVSTSTDGFGCNYSPAAEAKLLFTSKRRSREELLHDMRRCSELRRPLFIFEQPCCIATSS
ncbi:Protein FAF-like, chloroplastic [Apostasia shenzhenica]|uniref:Protein FAF-like, chloroplastic n=1 Tax=Apostasia shenzhenica TaxID=1088818 RepID=A0A2I0AVG1_9ASPA|nr:Protein FAF-like, chloroplastic [Apostasia shenzhenica]